MYSTATSCIYSSAYFSTPLYRCRLLIILVDSFASLSTSPYPCPLLLLVYSSAYVSTPLYPWSLSTFPPCLTLLHYSPLLCFLVDSSACFVYSSAFLSTPLHPCLLLCIRIYSSPSVSTPMPLCLLFCLLVDTSESLFLPLHECQDPCCLFLSP